MKDLSRRNNFSYHSSTNYWRWSICFWEYWIDYRGKRIMLYQPGAQPHRGETTGDSAGQDGWKGEKAYLWPTLLHSGQDIRCFNIQLFKTGFWLTTWAQLWLDQLCEGAGGPTGEHLDPTLKTFKPGVNVPLPEEIFKVDIKEESPAWGFIFSSSKSRLTDDSSELVQKKSGYLCPWRRHWVSGSTKLLWFVSSRK